MILGGLLNNHYLCDVTKLSIAKQSTAKAETIVENNATGHIKFGSDGNSVAKVADGHIVFYGNDDDFEPSLYEFKESTGRVDLIKKWS